MICKWFSLCPMKKYFENGRLNKKWIDEYCLVSNKNCIRYIMEEKGEYHPDWMLPDGTLDKTLK